MYARLGPNLPETVLFGRPDRTNGKQPYNRKRFIYMYIQENMRGQRVTLRALARLCRYH